jgi:hypothetical protein
VLAMLKGAAKLITEHSVMVQFTLNSSDCVAFILILP